jgi:hypothetical protein
VLLRQPSATLASGSREQGIDGLFCRSRARAPERLAGVSLLGVGRDWIGFGIHSDRSRLGPDTQRVEIALSPR